MATTVKITETYDLKTTKGKVGIIGVHTPQVTLLRKLYPGLMKNHRFMRFVRCDVVGAVAQQLPADPLQVGVTAGKVAPEDMFNPILYTAVSNESYDTLVARVRALTDVSTLGSVAEGNFMADTYTEEQNFKAYYGLLSEHGKYRKAMPQSGFMIRGLVPLAHTVISTFGNVGAIGNASALATNGEDEVSVPDMDVPEVSSTFSATDGHEIFYRGRAIKMPKFPLHTGLEGASDIPYPNVPKTYVLALVTPPCRLNEFYYRMRVTWTVRFEQVCTTLEGSGPLGFQDVGANSYGSNYSFSESKSEMENDVDSVSTDNLEITKIMES